MKQNLGKLDRIFRFALGVVWLGPWAPETGMLWLNWLVVIFGIIALLESFLGWCFIHQALNINNKNQ